MQNISMAEYPPEWMPNCLSIEQLLQNRAIFICLHFQAVLNAIILVVIFALIQQYFRHRIVIHPNLLIIFANIIFLYFVFILATFSMIFRYLILLLFYKHPCELLTPVWATFILFLPYYLYMFAFPAFHFFVMVERVRATFLAEKYENEGIRFGLAISVLIWLTSLAFLIFITFSALADIKTFSQPLGIMSLNSQYNRDLLFYSSICTIPFALIIPFVDWRIWKINTEKKKKDFSLQKYSLSRNYQLNENALTLRLILPLDIAYACIFSIYLIIMSLLRANRPFLSQNEFMFYTYLITTLCYFYILVALIVYFQFVRFMRFRGKRNEIHKILPEQSKQTNLHFEQLKAQWT